MNRLFVVDKPIFVSSNRYMNVIKRRYGIKKVGFSGTLDPFATGCLIVATGHYTKLLPYLKKTPKTYRATLWLGATSPSLDIENVVSVKPVEPLKETFVRDAITSLRGEITYLPPKYSAKKIDGKRAYDLAREGKEVALKTVTSTVYDITLLHYNHPFVTFEATVSEGTYIRSIGALIAEKLGIEATLSALRRLKEGDFNINNEEPINPFHHLRIPQNIYTGQSEHMEQGKKLSMKFFQTKADGVYLVETKNFYSIVEIAGNEVRYRLNRIPKYDTTPLKEISDTYD
jgi:tRNA pseudouridine55 synthase